MAKTSFFGKHLKFFEIFEISVDKWGKLCYYIEWLCTQNDITMYRKRFGIPILKGNA